MIRNRSNSRATLPGPFPVTRCHRIGFTPKTFVWFFSFSPALGSQHIIHKCDIEHILHIICVFFRTDEGIYNTYIIDTDSKAWALIMHCAEKSRSPRYLSALLLSREKSLGTNVVNFLRLDFAFDYVYLLMRKLSILPAPPPFTINQREIATLRHRSDANVCHPAGRMRSASCSERRSRSATANSGNRKSARDCRRRALCHS